MRASTTRFLALPLAVLAVATGARAQRESEFMQEFRKLMQIHSQEEMVNLVKQHQPQALLAVIETCEAIGQASNDTLEEEIDALNKAWKKAFDSRFVELQYNYFSLELTGVYKKHRRELIDQYLVKYKQYEEAEQKKDAAKLPAVGLDMQGLGDALASLGDHYMASQCYRVYASCFDDRLMGDEADYKRACEGWKQFVEAREKIELLDQDRDVAKQRFEQLEKDGYGDPAKGPEGRAAESAAADPGSAPEPLHATFELVPDLEAILRPMYTADTNYQMWPTVNLGKVDSSATIPTLEKSPAILRLAAAKAAVDLNGDGKGDVEIPLTGKIAPVQVTLGEGDEQRPWAFLAVIGQTQDTYQGFRFNLGPDENQMAIFVAAAASLVGTVNGVRVRVIDDNLDGIYGSPPKEWAYIGVRDGSFQRDVDTVVVGESKVARPWSELQKIGDAWYKLEPDPTGRDLVATKTVVESGTLQLDFKDGDPSWLLMRGTGNNDKLVFDLVNGGQKKVEVPVGTYELLAGQLTSGKRAQMMKALILPPGKNSRTWRVAAGETVKVELGAPFGFAFELTQDESTVKLDGNSIVVTGRGGETYQRLWNCVLAPEVLLRKEGTTKGKKGAKLVPAGSQEDLQAHKDDYRVCWFPIAEPIEKPNPGDTLEVQLFEKKHKLFGKIESEWKK